MVFKNKWLIEENIGKEIQFFYIGVAGTLNFSFRMIFSILKH